MRWRALGVLAFALPLSAGQPQVAQVQDDTLDASQHVMEIIRAWHPDSLRAYCVVSHAQWVNYVYIRHVQRVRVSLGECAAPAVPLLLQLPTCPPNAPILAEWTVIQCGPQHYRRYTLRQPQT